MNYSQIIPYDSANGDGWRTSLFVSGCNFHCPGCFNQEAQNFSYGQPFTKDTLNTIIDLLKSDRIVGVSLLGGDPLWQDIEGLLQLKCICEIAHSLNKTAWIWSGFTWEEIFPIIKTDNFCVVDSMRQELISNCDVWVDGRFELSKRDLRLQWCGSSNQRVIDVKESLKHHKIIRYNPLTSK